MVAIRIPTTVSTPMLSIASVGGGTGPAPRPRRRSAPWAVRAGRDGSRRAAPRAAPANPIAPITPSCWPRSLRVGVYFVLFVCTSASGWMRCCSTGSTSWEILSPSNSVSDGLRRTTAVSWPWQRHVHERGREVDHRDGPDGDDRDRGRREHARPAAGDEVDRAEHDEEEQREHGVVRARGGDRDAREQPQPPPPAPDPHAPTVSVVAFGGEGRAGRRDPQHEVRGERHDPVRRQEEVRHAPREVIREVRVEQGDHPGDATGGAERPEHEEHRHGHRGEGEDVEDVHRGADVAGHGAEHLQPHEVQVVEADREVEELLVERRAEVGVGEEPEVVDPALREHLVEGRVGLVGVDPRVAPDVRERDVEVGVPQLEHRHEDHQRGDGDQDGVEQERAAGRGAAVGDLAVGRAPRPIHGGTVTGASDADASRRTASPALFDAASASGWSAGAIRRGRARTATSPPG